MHDPPEPVIVVHRVVLRTAVVPERHRPRLPTETARQLGTDLLCEQIVEEWLAFLLAPAPKVRGVRAVHEQGLASGLGMRAHGRVLADERLELDAGVSQAILARPRDLRLRRRVDGNEALERLTEPGRQRLVGEVLIREQRVSTVRRHLDGVEHARHRRTLEIRRVGVPHAAEVRGLVLELDDGRDQRTLGKAAELRILHRLAEAFREAQLADRRKLLAAEEDHEVIEQRAADLRDDVFAQILREIHAVDLGAERTRRRPDVDPAIRRSRGHRSGNLSTPPARGNRGSESEISACDRGRDSR